MKERLGDESDKEIYDILPAAALCQYHLVAASFHDPRGLLCTVEVEACGVSLASDGSHNLHEEADLVRVAGGWRRMRTQSPALAGWPTPSFSREPRNLSPVDGHQVSLSERRLRDIDRKRFFAKKNWTWVLF